MALGADGSEKNFGIDGVNLDLSRDGSRLAMQRIDQASRRFDIWTYDLKREVLTRLTAEDPQDIGPVWSPDDSMIAYVAQHQGEVTIHVKPSSGAGATREIARAKVGLEVTDWSPDGRYLALEVFNEATSSDVGLIDLQNDPSKIRLIINGKFGEDSPRFSPDGKFLLYQSQETGQPEIYVQRFPLTDERWQVSSATGNAARWLPDGKGLVYLNADRRVVRVPFQGGATVTFGEPVLGGTATSLDMTRPAADGTIYTTRERQATDAIHILTNWQQTLKAE